jgi:hypothetical protein
VQVDDGAAGERMPPVPRRRSPRSRPRRAAWQESIADSRPGLRRRGAVQQAAQPRYQVGREQAALAVGGIAARSAARACRQTPWRAASPSDASPCASSAAEHPAQHIAHAAARHARDCRRGRRRGARRPRRIGHQGAGALEHHRAGETRTQAPAARTKRSASMLGTAVTPSSRAASPGWGVSDALRVRQMHAWHLALGEWHSAHRRRAPRGLAGGERALQHLLRPRAPRPSPGPTTSTPARASSGSSCMAGARRRAP